MKKAITNKDYVPSWDTCTSESYIRDCYRLYHKKWSLRYSLNEGDYAPYRKKWVYGDWQYHYTGASTNWVYIEKLYTEGRTLKILGCDFDQFSYRLIKGHGRGHYTHWSYLTAPFRQKHEQVKWKNIPKKTISIKEQAKLDWRETKQVARDKRKTSYTRSAPKWVKRFSNKMHRQWEREKIQRQDWGDMSNQEYKFFLDSWIWD